MYYFIYPNSDTTIYEGSLTQSLNAGRDAIIEVQKIIDDSGTIMQNSRVLIKFDYTDITRKRNSGIIPTNAKYYLNLFDANSEELAVEQTLNVYMVSGSWTHGSGKSDSNPAIEDGASWKYRSGTNPWKSGSFAENAPESMGGAWFTSSFTGQYEVSNSFDLKYETKDLRIDVTSLVNNQILSSSLYGNNGFLLKRPDSSETSSLHLGTLKFFSKETNTIYPPKLEVEWDDSVWNTGSLSPLSSTDLERLKIYFKGIRPEYKEKSKVRFRLVGRELYPTRGFNTTPAALTVKTLPSVAVTYPNTVSPAKMSKHLKPFCVNQSVISSASTGSNILTPLFIPDIMPLLLRVCCRLSPKSLIISPQLAFLFCQ